jgi:hypothetical protein
MKHLRLVVFGVVAMALCAVPVAVAQAAPPGGAAVTPVHRAGGLSGSELLGASWAAILEQPPEEVFGTCVPLGPTGNVIAPIAGFDLTVSCTVKPGTPLYFSFGSECSSVEEPPFFGADAEAQRACALAFDQEFFVAASVAVDGGEPVETLAPRFEVFSPQVTVDLPPDNLLGVLPQTATFVAHGWAFMLRGLRPGEHTITLPITDVEGVTTVAEVTVTVVPPGRAG